MAITVTPLPMYSGLGIGFWIDLKAQIATAVSAIEDNTDSDDSHDPSSDSQEVVQSFDPDVHTITEFLAAVDEILDAMRD